MACNKHAQLMTKPISTTIIRVNILLKTSNDEKVRVRLKDIIFANAIAIVYYSILFIRIPCKVFHDFQIMAD